MDLMKILLFDNYSTDTTHLCGVIQRIDRKIGRQQDKILSGLSFECGSLQPQDEVIFESYLPQTDGRALARTMRDRNKRVISTAWKWGQASDGKQ
jgi:hypothetical protein